MLAQPSGFRPEMPDLFYKNNIKGWGPALCARRPDITMAMVDAFLKRMYRANPDFVFTVTRDFVRDCQTPILVLPDDVPAHPYAVAMEFARLAPNAEVSIYPWKETKDRFPRRCATCAPSSRHIGLQPPPARPINSHNQPVASRKRGSRAAAHRLPLGPRFRGNDGSV